MTATQHICGKYEFTIRRAKSDGAVRAVEVCFDLPVGLQPEGGVKEVLVDAQGRIAFAFADGLTVALPDSSEKMLAALAGTQKISICYSMADGSLRETEIVRPAQAA